MSQCQYLNTSPEQEDQWENDKRDCLARELLNNKTHDEIREWLTQQKGDYREDMRRRINEQRQRRKPWPSPRQKANN